MRENIDNIRVFVINLREIVSLIIFYKEKSYLIKLKKFGKINTILALRTSILAIFTQKNESFRI